MGASPSCARTTYGLLLNRGELGKNGKNCLCNKPGPCWKKKRTPRPSKCSLKPTDQDWYKYKDDKLTAIPCSSFSLYQTQIKINMATSLPEFSLQGKIAVITGGARYV